MPSFGQDASSEPYLARGVLLIRFLGHTADFLVDLVLELALPYSTVNSPIAMVLDVILPSRTAVSVKSKSSKLKEFIPLYVSAQIKLKSFQALRVRNHSQRQAAYKSP